MTRLRLREAHTPEELAELYPKPHKHDKWLDHRLRVDATILLASHLEPKGGWGLAADLSCGDGAILSALSCSERIFGDLASGNGWLHVGPMEQTLDDIPRVNLFICSETLEHLDDPDLVLRKIREKTDYLLLSTPIGETDNRNPEHYWGWGVEDILDMLIEAEFHTKVGRIDLRLSGYEYDYQIWLVR